jgi:hypothetical protein
MFRNAGSTGSANFLYGGTWGFAMAMFNPRAPQPRKVAPGTDVEVFTRYESHWVGGFEVAAVEDDGKYLLRRRSDRAPLPTRFDDQHIRPRR